MQFNTTTALVTAIISAVIGFGLAFLIERKISSRMHKKSQRVLTSMAMASFGFGLTAFLNEVVGFPLQGLHIRYDKLIGYLLVNILLLPIVLLVIAKLIGSKNNEISTEKIIHTSDSLSNPFKYILIFVSVVFIAYIGYTSLDGSSSGATYDFYDHTDSKNCNSPFENTPMFSSKFLFKKETNEIFMTMEYDDNGTIKKQITKLGNCSILDSKNWKCGGDISGSYLSPKYMFVDGDFTYDSGVSPYSSNCSYKIVKR
jgi:hypothetical protein